MPQITLDKTNSIMIDTMIQESSPDTNYNTGSTLVAGVYSGPMKSRVLLKADLGLVPNDAIIESAQLILYKEAGSGRRINVHRLTQALEETVTWNAPRSFNGVAVGGLDVPSTNGSTSFDITSLVQDWVNGVYPNNGLLLKALDEVTTGTITFTSNEGATVANRPKILITYTIPTTGKKQVEYVGTGGMVNTTTNSLTTPLPSGVQVGDLLIAQIGLGSDVIVTTPPAGWTISKSDEGTASGYGYVFAYKFVSAGETAPTFSFSSNVAMSGVLHAYRNVKGVYKTPVKSGPNSSSTSVPSAFNTSLIDALFVVMNTNSATNAKHTPPKSYEEKYEANGLYSNFQIMQRYTYNNGSQTQADMTTSLSATSSYGNIVYALDPIQNTPPTLTLSSPADNQTLTEGSDYPVEGSATEADAGNVVTVKFRINGGATLDAGTGTSDGATPITFSKNLVFQGDRLYDGSTDVSGILAEGTTHTLYVWAVDDQGGITAEQTRSFTVVYNAKPGTPTIVSPADTKRTPLRPVFEVTIGDDVENDSQHFILQLSTANDFSAGLQEFKTQTATAGWELHDGTQYVPFPGTGAASIFEGRNLRYTAQADLTENTTYYWRMAAVDATSGATGVWTPTRSIRAGNVLQWAIDPKVTDAPARRVVLNLIKNIATDGTVPAQLTVKVANNALDVSPAWEDATAAFLAGEYYDFTNAAKTAAQWAVGIEITVQANDSLGAIEVDADGYSFD